MANLYIRVPDDDLKGWRETASASGMNLSAWVRSRCNDPIATKCETAGAKMTYTPTAPVYTKPRSAGACAHGTLRGFHCWKCGGVAKVATA